MGHVIVLRRRPKTAEQGRGMAELRTVPRDTILPLPNTPQKNRLGEYSFILRRLGFKSNWNKTDHHYAIERAYLTAAY